MQALRGKCEWNMRHERVENATGERTNTQRRRFTSVERSDGSRSRLLLNSSRRIETSSGGILLLKSAV